MQTKLYFQFRISVPCMLLTMSSSSAAWCGSFEGGEGASMFLCGSTMLDSTRVIVDDSESRTLHNQETGRRCSRITSCGSYILVPVHTDLATYHRTFWARYCTRVEPVIRLSEYCQSLSRRLHRQTSGRPIYNPPPT